MNTRIGHDLHHVFHVIKQETDHRWPLVGDQYRTLNIPENEFLAKALSVFDILKESPYLNGKTIAEKVGLNRDHLSIAYKVIQRSDACQGVFKASANRDYFNVVNHYFNQDMYTLVFFVGNSCPSRCIYCPNVKVDSLGRRRLMRYPDSKRMKLSEETLAHVFADLEEIQKGGTNILVKISGGLEPLTDIDTVAAIIGFCDKLNLPVKLFTNGILLKNQEKRKTALQTGDIRISLSTADEQKYQHINFSSLSHAKKPKALSQLKESIRQLIRERPSVNPSCRIGLNSIILPDNHLHLVPLLEMARDLGIDYVDFKPDYFSSYDSETMAAMEASVEHAKHIVTHDSYQNLHVNFTSSLSRRDLFWHPWDGQCNTMKQSYFKLFITPFGHCSPVHYGAFPHRESSKNSILSHYSIGELDNRHSLLDVLNEPLRLPQIELKKLNPFELMLNLEITREEDDEIWGIPMSVSPYHTGQRKKLPADLFLRANQQNLQGN